MRYLLFSLIFSQLNFGHSLLAQTTWTIDQCVELAIQKDVSIKLSQIDRELSEVDRNAAFQAFFPDVNMFTTYGLNTGRNVDPLTNAFTNTKVKFGNISLSGEISLFEGFSRIHNLKMAKVNNSLSSIQAKIKRRDAEIVVLTACVDVLMNQKLLEEALNQYNKVLQMEENTEGLLLAGRATKLDVAAVKTEKAKVQSVLQEAKNRLSYSSQLVQYLMDVPVDTSFKIKDEFSLNKREISEAKFDVFPEFEESKMKSELTYLELKKARSEYFPKIIAQYRLGSGYSDNYFLVDPSTNELFVPSFQNQLNLNVSQSISFTLLVPIYSRGITRNRIKKAKINVDQAKLLMKKQENDVMSAVKLIEMELLNANSSYMGAQEIETLAKEEVELARFQHEKGALSKSDLIEKESAYFTNKFNKIQKAYTLYLKEKIYYLYHN